MREYMGSTRHTAAVKVDPLHKAWWGGREARGARGERERSEEGERERRKESERGGSRERRGRRGSREGRERRESGAREEREQSRRREERKERERGERREREVGAALALSAHRHIAHNSKREDRTQQKLASDQTRQTTAHDRG